jgi:Amt family ammonium transporter
MTGGATALTAAVILGPRIGRFHDEDGNALDKPVTFPPHSVSLQVLGTFILWFGWYGFNPGSTIVITGMSQTAALCAVTTTMAAASGAISALFTDSILVYMDGGETEYDLSMVMNGCLGGLVAITSGCAVVEPWAAVVIGLIGGLVYVFSSKLLVKLKIDDAVDAIPVHFFNGMWGCIATGFFASPRLTVIAYETNVGVTNVGHGVFYGDGKLLVCQIFGVLFILCWTVGIMTPFFIGLNQFGMFRVDAIEEQVGLDISHHKGSAYNLEGPSGEQLEKWATAHGKQMVPSA